VRADAPQARITGGWLFATFAALIVLAVVSFLLSLANLGRIGVPVALAIAALKAALVALVFMELIVEKLTFRLVLILVVLFFALLIGGVWADIDTRMIPPLLPPH
jgi:cytochrome c oxidase subunit 4